jgi:hypothetical protein
VCFQFKEPDGIMAAISPAYMVSTETQAMALELIGRAGQPYTSP